MSQGLLYIPDGIAMLMLMAVLLYLRRRSRARDTTLWMVGLSFILLEALASDAYRVNVGQRNVLHMVALCMFVLAGFAFAWSAIRDGAYRNGGLVFCISGAVPLLLLAKLYGFEFDRSAPYQELAIAGMAAQLICVAVFLRGPGWIAVGMPTVLVWWGPMVWFARMGQYRGMIYWGLGVLYLLVALVMSGMLRRSRVGGATVVTGFVIWSACLLCHPYISAASIAGKLVDQIWTMQKFVVTIGLLLVLLDEECGRNQELALNDPLTGLPNRRLLEDRLQQAVERSSRYGVPFALFAVDLDGFKAINDQLGHAQGDLVLCEAARRLLSVVRSSDTLGRTGGDEFLVVVNEIKSRESCDAFAQILRTALAEPGEAVNEEVMTLSGSVGYALYPMHAGDAKSLMMAADRSMYRQKTLAGRNSQEMQMAAASKFVTYEAGR